MKDEHILILREIEKTHKLYPEMDKYIIIKINEDKDTCNKSFEFRGMFDGGIESIEATHSLTTLNQVMKALLNDDYALTFEYEIY